MLDYGAIFPESRLPFWDRYGRLRGFKNRVAQSFFGLTQRHLLRHFQHLSPDCIPVVIINFNRLEALATLVDWLLTLPANLKLIILDNHSTYAPLLRYYQTLAPRNVRVIYMNDNYGPGATLRLAPALRTFEHYIITDSDLVPTPATPADIIQKMAATLECFPAFNHVGASLEINDIPACYPFQDLVLQWESQHWRKPLNADVYEAAVDTTFAMYRGTSDATSTHPALRLARPYTLRHLDWYVDPQQLSEEYAFYLKTCSNKATWATKLRGEGHAGGAR